MSSSTNAYLDSPLFLCGAPRSATTLLHNLLDGHENILSIPIENQIGDKYGFYQKHNPSKLSYYFYRDYIHNFDVQISYNKPYADFIIGRSKKRFGKDTENPSLPGLTAETAKAFVNTYQTTYGEISDKGRLFDLTFPYKALATAYQQVFYVQNKFSHFLLRRNVINEILALELKAHFPKAKFIHILRDPRSRYLSAIERATAVYPFGIKVRRRVGEYDFCTHRALVSLLSFQLAIRNKEIMGDDYLIIKHEDITANRQETMKNVADFINIPFSAGLLNSTNYGLSTSVNSSFKETGSVLEKSITQRVDLYNKSVSPQEKYIINYYCAQVANEFGYSMDVESSRGLSQNLSLMKHEYLPDYFFNRLKSMRRMSSNYIFTQNELSNEISDKILYDSFPMM